MGWAKYFEDIQKLRDHAASLRDARLYQRAVSSAPEKAAQQLKQVQQVQVTISRWSEELIGKLDEILEQATDPEIDRQLTIDVQNESIARLGIEIEGHLAKISALTEQREALQVDLFAAKREIANLQQAKRSSDAALVSAQKENEKLRQTNLALEEEIQRVQQREREVAKFGNLMRDGGVRPLRK